MGHRSPGDTLTVLADQFWALPVCPCASCGVAGITSPLRQGAELGDVVVLVCSLATACVAHAPSHGRATGVILRNAGVCPATLAVNLMWAATAMGWASPEVLEALAGRLLDVAEELLPRALVTGAHNARVCAPPVFVAATVTQHRQSHPLLERLSGVAFRSDMLAAMDEGDVSILLQALPRS